MVHKIRHLLRVLFVTQVRLELRLQHVIYVPLLHLLEDPVAFVLEGFTVFEELDIFGFQILLLHPLPYPVSQDVRL